MGWGRNASIMHTSLQGRQDKYFFLEKELKNKAWLINTGLNIVFKLD